MLEHYINMDVINQQEQGYQHYPLTDSQKTILFECLLWPKKRLYVEQIIIDLRDEFLFSKVKSTWIDLFRKHFMLSACVVCRNTKTPYLKIIDNQPSIEIIRLNCQPGCVKEKIHNIAQDMWEEAVNFEKNSFHVTIIEINENRCFLILDYHHLFFDGWSIVALIQEFYTMLEAQPLVLEAVKEEEIYKQYLLQYYNKKKKSAEFWTHHLPDSLGNSRPVISSYEEGRTTFEYYARNIKACQLKAQQNQVTLAACLYFLWAKMLKEVFRQEQVCFSVTVSGRTSGVVHIDKLIGMFIHNLPLALDNSIFSADPFIAIRKILCDITQMQEQIPSLSTFLAEHNYSLSNYSHSVVTVQNYPNHFAHKKNGLYILESRKYQNTVPLLWAIRYYDDRVYFDFSFDKNKYSYENIREAYHYLTNAIEHLSFN